MSKRVWIDEMGWLNSFIATQDTDELERNQLMGLPTDVGETPVRIKPSFIGGDFPDTMEIEGEEIETTTILTPGGEMVLICPYKDYLAVMG